MKQQESLPVLSTSGRTYSNTPLGRSISINSSSSSLNRLFLHSSCSNFVSPLHLPLKKIKPQPWQRLFQGEKQQDVSTKKSTPTVGTTINENFIKILNETSLFEDNSQSSFLPGPLQSHIDHLYEQIDDLTSQLSEERSKHKQTRFKAGETLLNQLKDQEEQFEDLLAKKLLDHQNELKEQENKYQQLLDEEQTKARLREKELNNELEFLKKLFHIYKTNLDKEKTEQIHFNINEILGESKEQTPENEEPIDKKINDAVTKERKRINQRQKIEIENIKKQHQNEIANIRKTFDDATLADRECLELINKELTVTKAELNKMKGHVISLTTQLKDLETEHIKTIQELNDYRQRFDEEMQEIEKLNV